MGEETGAVRLAIVIIRVLERISSCCFLWSKVTHIVEKRKNYGDIIEIPLEMMKAGERHVRHWQRFYKDKECLCY